MTETKINKTVAHELAIGFLPEVRNFIEQNKDAYIDWLKENGLSDENYYTAADNGAVVNYRAPIARLN